MLKLKFLLEAEQICLYPFVIFDITFLILDIVHWAVFFFYVFLFISVILSPFSFMSLFNLWRLCCGHLFLLSSAMCCGACFTLFEFSVTKWSKQCSHLFWACISWAWFWYIVSVLMSSLSFCVTCRSFVRCVVASKCFQLTSVTDHISALYRSIANTIDSCNWILKLAILKVIHGWPYCWFNQDRSHAAANSDDNDSGWWAAWWQVRL